MQGVSKIPIEEGGEEREGTSQSSCGCDRARHVLGSASTGLVDEAESTTRCSATGQEVTQAESSSDLS